MEKTQPTQTQNVPKTKNKLRKTARRRKVIELKAQGKTIATIAEELKVSEKTIDRDLQSQDVQKFTDELIRRQIIDIEHSKPSTRLHFRSDLLDKLLPKKMEQKIEGGENWTVEIIDHSQTTQTRTSPPTT